MLRQLKNAPTDLLIEATFTAPSSSTLRTAHLYPHNATHPHRQPKRTTRLLHPDAQLNPRGQTRRHRRQFYRQDHPLRGNLLHRRVIQPVREWVPAAPKASELGRDEHLDDDQVCEHATKEQRTRHLAVPRYTHQRSQDAERRYYRSWATGVR